MPETIEIPSTNPYFHEGISQDPEHWKNVFEVIEGFSLSQSPAERAVQVSSLNGEGIMEAATRLHTVLAPELGHNTVDYTMKAVSRDGTVTHEFLSANDRPAFFEHTAAKLHELAASIRPGDEEQYLVRAANVVGMSIVLAHPFENANGRTARVLADAILEGPPADNPALQEEYMIMGSERTYEGMRINSYVPRLEGQHLSPYELIDVAAAVEIPLSQQSAYNQLRSEAFVTPQG